VILAKRRCKGFFLALMIVLAGMGGKAYAQTGATAYAAFDAVSDSFNACVVDDALWTWVDPQAGEAGESTYRVTGRQFEIVVPGGVGHPVDAGGNQAPRLMQAVNDVDFTVQVRFDSSLTDGSQFQGVLIEQDADNFLHLRFQYDGANAALEAVKFVGGVPATIWTRPLVPNTGQGPIYLQIIRNSDAWEVGYSFDGIDWINDVFTYTLTVSQIGLSAGNYGDNPTFTALIDYFYNADSPVSIQDIDILTFDDLVVSMVSNPISPPGFGEVVGEPETPTPGNPQCGSPLKVTANPVVGWRFDRWRLNTGSGMTEDTNNPLVYAFKVGDSLEALFEQVSYTLDVYPVYQGKGRGGDVLIVPDNPVYYYNDVVTLTAQVETGWTFDGWSGDLVSSNPIETVVMTESKVITATFVQLSYPLTVTTAGNGQGTVTRNPVKDAYLYGETVTVTATVSANSVFGGWSGDLPAGADPMQLALTLIMDRPKTLTATFNRVYFVYLPTVSRSE